jgi:tripartite-type tricarboxylate transporter receptor subunit TctC
MTNLKLPHRRQFLHLAAGAAALAMPFVGLISDGAWSQATRTIKIVVPFPAGGSADILARLLVEQVGRMQSASLVVENRPGADTVIGTEAVARAAPDGNTLLINANPFVTNPHLGKPNYDPLTSFEPICHLASSPIVIVVNATSPYRTFADLLAAARVKPGNVTLASIPTFRIAFEMLKRAAGVDMTFVPYPGNAPAVSALLGDHVTSVLAVYPTVAEQVKAGKLRAIVTTSQRRIEPQPDLPTVAEAGYKDYSEEAWFGLVAPAKTPKEILTQVSGLFTTAMNAPEIKLKLQSQGLYPVGVCGADFATFLRGQYDAYGRVIREANIKAQ